MRIGGGMTTRFWQLPIMTSAFRRCSLKKNRGEAIGVSQTFIGLCVNLDWQSVRISKRWSVDDFQTTFYK
jgi:hypothetical protein